MVESEGAHTPPPGLLAHESEACPGCLGGRASSSGGCWWEQLLFSWNPWRIFIPLLDVVVSRDSSLCSAGGFSLQVGIIQCVIFKEHFEQDVFSCKKIVDISAFLDIIGTAVSLKLEILSREFIRGIDVKYFSGIRAKLLRLFFYRIT